MCQVRNNTWVIGLGKKRTIYMNALDFMGKTIVSYRFSLKPIQSDWWFGTCFIFHILGIIIPIDFFFRRGRYTTNQIASKCSKWIFALYIYIYISSTNIHQYRKLYDWVCYRAFPGRLDRSKTIGSWTAPWPCRRRHAFHGGATGQTLRYWTRP